MLFVGGHFPVFKALGSYVRTCSGVRCSGFSFFYSSGFHCSELRLLNCSGLFCPDFLRIFLASRRRNCLQGKTLDMGRGEIQRLKKKTNETRARATTTTRPATLTATAATIATEAKVTATAATATIQSSSGLHPWRLG